MLIPGTMLQAEHPSAQTFDAIFPVMGATNGLMLSQICEITGLEGSTVQNWVKRSWVSKPQGKRYGRLQLARILIINLLKDTLRLERIVQLLSSINGDVDNRADDMIDECELYNALCSVIFAFEKSGKFDPALLKSWVMEASASYQPKWTGARERLHDTLLIMMSAYLSARLKKQAIHLLDNFVSGGDEHG